MAILFSLTIFLSAALLFLLQPLFARIVLPELGGSPAVWNTAMVFYQSVLLAGYAYAHVSIRWAGTLRQRWLHLAVLVLPLLVLPIALPAGWTPPTEHNPIPWVLALFAVAVGLPFFAVSTSGPLLQKWYSATSATRARDPYFLFAASNLGSLIGLLAYPFLLEPHLTLPQQRLLWTGGYGIFALLTVVCAVTIGQKANPAAPQLPAVAPPEADERPGPWRRFRWVALAFVPSSLMLGVTQHLSNNVASVPLLWVIPLAIYILSFVLVFMKRALLPWTFVVRSAPFAVVAVMLMLIYNVDRPMALVMGVHLTGLAIIAIACHGALSRDRPHVAFLTEFYLWLAVGGALGGVFNALIAPVVFSRILEYPIVVAIAGMVLPTLAAPSMERRERIADAAVPAVVAVVCAGTIWLTRSLSEFRDLADTRLVPSLLMLTLLPFARRPLRFGLAMLALFVVGHVDIGQGQKLVVQERTFFGVHRVVYDENAQLQYLYHGPIIHGVQSRVPGKRGEPLSYYHRTGPLGQVIQDASASRGAMKVALIGLGSGSLAAYARSGDAWTYYEIDPTMVSIARDTTCFTFLSESHVPIDVVLGDARRALRTATQRYDLIVLDAYSSDYIPIHLLTREALDLYLRRLTPDGILLFHISSRHFRLAPVVAALADDAGLVCRIRDDRHSGSGELDRGQASSTAAVLARLPANLAGIADDDRWRDNRSQGARVWTDDYSSLFDVLRWR